MRVTITSKGDFKNVLDWLNRSLEPKGIVHEIGRDGVKSLSANTPKDTGETASGWDYRIDVGARMSEIVWFNSAHPESSSNVAKLIELGHGTSNGGFVQPRPYIQKAMDGVFKDAGDKIAKGMTE